MDGMRMNEMDSGRADEGPVPPQPAAQPVTQPVPPDLQQGAETGVTPGDQLRSLPDEAGRRGSRLVSARAMQARLFSVYDAAAAAEDALALVQRQLTLTLDRQYYDADEIEQMASELDSLLALESELGSDLSADLRDERLFPELGDEGLVPEG